MQQTVSAENDRKFESLFADQPDVEDDSGGKAKGNDHKPWKVMIIDDDHAVHDVSRLVFNDFNFMEQGIELIHGYSGAEARQLMELHPDTAVMLLDVVMETDSAGLDVVNYVRQNLNNKHVQIILRTGQPGLAPEVAVARDYEINDYRDKSELTTEKLTTALITSLRVFREMKEIQRLAMADEALQNTAEAGMAVLNKSSADTQTESEPCPQDDPRVCLLRGRILGLMSDSSAAIYIKNREGRYVLANAQFERLTDVSFETLIGKTDHEVLATELADQLSENDKAVLDGNETMQFNEEFTDNGVKVTYVTVKFPLYSAQHRPFGVCSISTALSEWQ